MDTWAAVGAEVAAAFRISLAMAGSFLRYALAMRERLPQVAAVFRAGDIDYRLFQTIGVSHRFDHRRWRCWRPWMASWRCARRGGRR